ncbi:MAG: efflux RND transporter permease subunit [Myxococcota bacterium]
MKALLFNPRLVATFVGLLVVAGLASLGTIVRQEDPTITNGIGVIVTPYPGASAERVERLVTEKVEDELQELAEIGTLSSTSRDSVSVVVVELDEQLQGKEAERAFSRIRDALNDAEANLPAGSGTPSLDDERFGAYTWIVGLRWTASTPARIGLLKRYAEELQARLRNISGTDTVKVFGSPEEQVLVEVDADALNAAGLSVRDVAGAIARADAKGAAGILRTETLNAPIELRGEVDSLERVRRVPLSLDGAAQLQVGYVADVRREVQDPPPELAFVDGAPAVVVAAQLATGVRFDGWRAKASAALEDFERIVPSGIETRMVFDQTGYTEARLSTLVTNLLSGLLIVVLVLFLTLGWRSAVVVSLTLPLVSLACLAVLNAMSVPIHQMSVTGLIVALGLLVDAAIVMVDAVRYRIASGMAPMDAAQESLRRLWLPLTSSTLTTVLAFMPILLLPGRVGEFVGTIGLSVIVALLASWIIALVVIPSAGARFLAPVRHAPRLGRSSWLQTGVSWEPLGSAFDRSLRWSLKHPWASMALVTLVPTAGVLGATTVPRQFFPPADRDQFHVEVRMAPATSIAHTEEVVHRLDGMLRAQPEVRSTAWFLARSAPPFYYNLKQDQDGNAAYAQALVDATSVSAVAEVIRRLQPEVDSTFPEAQIILRELLQGPPVDAPVELRVYGPDIEVLRSLGAAYRLRMSRVPEVTHTRATLQAGTPKLWFAADEARARRAGLRLTDIAQQLATRLEGTVGGSLLEGPEELPVRVRVSRPVRQDFGQMTSLGLVPGPDAGIPVQTVLRTGADAFGSSAPETLPMSALGRFDIEPVWARIPHRNGERVNIIRAYTEVGVYPETGLVGFRNALTQDPVQLPPGYRMEFGGDAEERGEAMAGLFASVPVLVLLMVACVALSLNSFRLGAVVFIVAGQSMGLGLLCLTVSGYPLGFQAMIGLIGLVGVAINAAIVISSALSHDAAAASGDPNAIQRVVTEETSRHIISTTITTFGGFIPLIISGGGFWPPFAVGIAGGVLLSSLLSFFFVPAAYMLVARSRPVRRTFSVAGQAEVFVR